MFGALMWYTIETRSLKNWQKKLTQLTYLQTHINVVNSEFWGVENKKIVMQQAINIIDRGNLDVEKIFAKGFVDEARRNNK